MKPGAPGILGEIRRVSASWALALSLLVVGGAFAGERVYVGQSVCRECHPAQYRSWSKTKHAQAHVALAHPMAPEIARLSGIAENPYSNPICLGCHTTASDVEDWERDETFHSEDGVQCELCHGPGSEYIDADIMADRQAATAHGLKFFKETDCLVCHKEKGSHTTFLDVRVFDYEQAIAEIAHPGPAVAAGSVPAVDEELHRTDPSFEGFATPAGDFVQYKTPFNLVLSDDGARLFVACEASDSLVVVDTSRREVIAEIQVGNLPHGVCLSPDGSKAYVSNRGSDTVSVVDTAEFEETAVIKVGDEPHGLVTDAAGELLYVANAGSDDVSVVDLGRGVESKRLAAGRGAWDVALSPDGAEVFVTNNLSHYVKFRETQRSEVTVIGTERSFVTNRIMLTDANLVQGVVVSPDGAFVLVSLIRTKNLVPMTRILQGWVMTNGIGVLWKDGRVDQLLLDEPGGSFADPTDLVITPDGRFAYVTGGGIDSVAVVDLEIMKGVLEGASEKDRRDLLPNHLGPATEFVLKRIPVGRNPRGLTASADNLWVYVADGLDDTISVIDVVHQERVAVIDLGGPKEETLARRGERIFNSAEISFGRQFSCHSCHPDGGIDSITYDIEPDGIGLNPVDNRSLRGVLDTAPFKWTGKNPTLGRQCGPRLAVFFTRVDPFTPQQVEALERYICTIPRNPNRYRVLGADLTPAQRRGKRLFERTHTNVGALIPKEKRCISCHSPPYYTNREMEYVGVGSYLDTNEVFDVPHLTNVYETSPYLHDGRAHTLEEIWTRFNPHDDHGVTNDMTKDQLNDLVEFLKTL